MEEKILVAGRKKFRGKLLFVFIIPVILLIIVTTIGAFSLTPVHNMYHSKQSKHDGYFSCPHTYTCDNGCQYKTIDGFCYQVHHCKFQDEPIIELHTVGYTTISWLSGSGTKYIERVCTEDYNGPNLIQTALLYTFRYIEIQWIITIVLPIYYLLTILSYFKHKNRTVILTENEIKGKCHYNKEINIPYDVIKLVKLKGKRALVIETVDSNLRFKHYKNIKEIYYMLVEKINRQGTITTSATNGAVYTKSVANTATNNIVDDIKLF